MRRPALTLLLALLLGLTACESGDTEGETDPAIATIPSATGPTPEGDPGEAPSVDPLGDGPSECPTAQDATPAPDGTIAVDISGDGMTLDTSEIAEGPYTFEVTADPGEHRILVVRAASVDDLPRVDAGGVDRSLLGEDVVAELEAFDGADGPCAVTANLPPGDYVVLCNTVESDGTAHVDAGESTQLTVTPAGA